MGYEATIYLLERGVRLTGTDARSWDAPCSHIQALPARDCLAIVRALVDAEAERSAPAPDLEARIVRSLLGYLRPANTRQVSR